ncbi:MAG: Stk1 family PASTA domain-containing Ser/Thr kinase [Coriobacteriales bacterium]|nr:Stk1 family PASTA domain-containing Ser/Thr kinase [Coriobacteriales bacterium]
MAGRVLGGRYTVQDKIGTGGMATVYRGVDEVLGRTVAIKTMLPQYASDESFAARFKQEAQAAAALQSPYIVSVYDWGKDGDTYYIVMEYLRGIDLKSGIRRHGALDPQKVAQIGSQIAQALSIAHKHDIIHRDIKPQNIMVQQDGNIKVMDFGIARAKNSHITTDNSVLGTAHYVSPEQTQGKDLGPTTDIYSLGIVMYEAATGRVPFDGDDAISVALKQVNEQPLPPSQINPAVDPSLEGIILKCMQKNPADRFQTADELKGVLRDYLAGRIQAVNAATSGLNLTATQVTPVVDSRVSTGVVPAVNRVDGTSTGSRPLTATEHAQMEARRKRRARRIKTFFGILLAFAAIGAVAYAAMQMYAAGNATRSVPNLLNYTQEEALLAIDETDFFERGNVREEYSTTVDRGKVMDQDPDPQRQMARGTQINIWVSKGPEPAKNVTVPDLRGKTPSEAEALLEENNLVGRAGESVYDSEVEVNLVVKQTPAGGSVAKEGDVVTYQLSKGIESLEVPDVVGQDYYTADSKLTEGGFTVEVSYENSDSYDEGYVIRQSPTGMADKGSTVTIVVSTGPKLYEIPWIEGYSEGTARSMLEDEGFVVNVEHVESYDVEAGIVISQSDSGSARAGTVVSITVSNGPGPSANPPLDPDDPDPYSESNPDQSEDSGDSEGDN